MEQWGCRGSVLRVFFEMRDKSSDTFKSAIDEEIALGLGRNPKAAIQLTDPKISDKIKSWFPGYIKNRKLPLKAKQHFLSRVSDALRSAREFSPQDFPKLLAIYPIETLGLSILKEGSDPELISGPAINVNAKEPPQRPDWFSSYCEVTQSCLDSLMQIYLSGKLGAVENQTMLASIMDQSRDIPQKGLVKTLETIQGDEKKINFMVES